MSWHPDPGSCAVDSLQHSWRNLYGYAFSPFWLIGKVLAKVRKDQSLLLIVTPAWQTQPCYAVLLAMLVLHPIILPNLTTLLQGSQGQKHPLQEGNQLQLVAWQVSGKLWKVREYQNSMPHQSAWRKWASWCCERDVNPFTSNLIEILNFLAFLYEKGYEYSSINSHRSAISAYHVHIDNNPIGQHPRVCTLMTGIFNNRPPKPRYTFVWDIETVLNYLSKLLDNLNLPIRVLSHNLALLLSLTAASRVSVICCLNTGYMVEF